MDYIMWLLIGIYLYLAIRYIFRYLTGAYVDGFWLQATVMLLWPILMILFGYMLYLLLLGGVV